VLAPVHVVASAAAAVAAASLSALTSSFMAVESKSAANDDAGLCSA
jgi:hypothetical protein